MMNQQGPILVPLDGSELAESVLPVATATAHALRTPLVLAAVWQNAGAGVAPAVSVKLEERARDYFGSYLAGVRDGLQQREIRTMIRCGDACDEILDATQEAGARMIVAASHGRSGISRWLYGSTTARLLRESTVPLLVVGPHALRAPPVDLQVKHIMVPLDGSPIAEQAVETGVQLAGAFDARLSLVRVVQWAVQIYPYANEAYYIPVLDSDLEAAAGTYLEDQRIRLPGGVAARAFVVRGSAADALLTFEEEQAVDLVVMTTHARSGLARAALGSTADRMLQGIAPVLLLRPTPVAEDVAPAQPAEAISS